MSSNLDQQLEEVLQRRKRVRADLERLSGRQEQAQATLDAVKEEIRAKGIDPSEIDQKQLEDKYRSLIEDLERDTTTAERALAPFLKGT